MEWIKKYSLAFITGSWPPDKKKKTIVFIHGAASTGAVWMRQLIGLSAEFNIIVPDLPGHGMTEGNSCERVADYADSVRGLISDIGIKCIVAGISLGGAVAMNLMSEGFKLIEAGILMNTGAKLKVQPSIFEAVYYNYRNFIIGMSDILFPAKSTLKKIDKSLKIADIMKVKKNVAIDDFLACDNFDIRSRLNRISCPVLVISSENDVMTPPKYGEYLKKKIKKAEYVQIKNSGHFSLFEKYEEVNGLIENFIRDLEKQK